MGTAKVVSCGKPGCFVCWDGDCLSKSAYIRLRRLERKLSRALTNSVRAENFFPSSSSRIFFQPVILRCSECSAEMEITTFQSLALWLLQCHWWFAHRWSGVKPLVPTDGDPMEAR